MDLISRFEIKGIAHITGGGFIENMPRMLPEGLGINIFRDSWPVLPIFEILQSIGNLDERNMFNTFNMGIGMVMAVDANIAEDVLKHLNSSTEKAYIIGEVVSGRNGLELC